MSLKQWLANGKLQAHKTSPEEIHGLIELVERDMQNAKVEELTSDLRFSIAYNAALNLCTIPLLVSGYRTVPSQGGHHYITISALPETMGKEQKERARYLNTCRNKRHNSTYDNISLISTEEVEELLEEVQQFKEDVQSWLKSSKYYFG